MFLPSGFAFHYSERAKEEQVLFLLCRSVRSVACAFLCAEWVGLNYYLFSHKVLSHRIDLSYTA